MDYARILSIVVTVILIITGILAFIFAYWHGFKAGVLAGGNRASDIAADETWKLLTLLKVDQEELEEALEILHQEAEQVEYLERLMK